MATNENITMNDIVTETGQSEYMKIRSYVISQIVKAGDLPMRLASNREIGKQFGVSHSTVVKALKDLISDGYLTVKSGRRGIFTCPHRLGIPKNAKTIGILFDDGKKVFLDRNDWLRASVFANALLERQNDYLSRYVTLTSIRSCAAREILSMGLSGVIWISAHSSIIPAILELKRSSFPQIAIGDSIEGVSSTYINVESEYHTATAMMLDEGRRRVAIVLRGDSMAAGFPVLNGWKLAHSERRVPFDKSLILTHSPDLLLNFDKVLAKLKPDGICFATNIKPYYDIIINTINIVTECRLYSVSYNICDNKIPYTGYAGYQDYTQSAKASIDNLVMQMNDFSSAEVINIQCKTDIKMIR